MRVVSIVGARPQFVKAAPLVRALSARHASVLVHTGQHYDAEMSDIFFEELALPRPDHHLGVGSARHGAQTAEMMARLEPVLAGMSPDWVVVYGDTNSTLAGALVASKLRLPLAHVEAGLRSFDRRMPEEINRVVADTVADLLLCPTATAAANLAREGITRGVHVVGNLMAETLAEMRVRSERTSTILERLALEPRRFVLATVHRAGNTDDPERLRQIVAALDRSDEPVIFPVHPRTRPAFDAIPRRADSPIRAIAPVGYVDMVRLEAAARLIATDSGGVQKEAYWLGTPCVTLRDETEWVETVESGWNVLVGADPDRIADAIATFAPAAAPVDVDAAGGVSARLVALLEEHAQR